MPFGLKPGGRDDLITLDSSGGPEIVREEGQREDDELYMLRCEHEEEVGLQAIRLRKEFIIEQANQSKRLEEKENAFKSRIGNLNGQISGCKQKMKKMEDSFENLQIVLL